MQILPGNNACCRHPRQQEGNICTCTSTIVWLHTNNIHNSVSLSPLHYYYTINKERGGAANEVKHAFYNFCDFAVCHFHFIHLRIPYCQLPPSSWRSADVHIVANHRHRIGMTRYIPKCILTYYKYVSFSYSQFLLIFFSFVKDFCAAAPTSQVTGLMKLTLLFSNLIPMQK